MSIAVQTALSIKLGATSGVTTKVGDRIYHEQAPPAAQYPFVIFREVTGTKVRALDTPESFKHEVWLVKAIDRTGSPPSRLADEIAEAVDSALDGGTLTVSGKVVADLAHSGDVKFNEPDGDQSYRHSGANYKVTLTAP